MKTLTCVSASNHKPGTMTSTAVTSLGKPCVNEGTHKDGGGEYAGGGIFGNCGNINGAGMAGWLIAYASIIMLASGRM